MSCPVIGITCGINREEETWCLRQYYIEAVLAAGGLPMLLVPMLNNVQDILNNIDGLLFSGGGDIDPRWFGEDSKIPSGSIDPERDSFELLLCKEAWENQIPILGICRGMQVLNVALGGTVWQDISWAEKNFLIHNQQAPRWYQSHQIKISEPSKLLTVMGTKDIAVNSFHHQAVKDIPADLVVAAVANDGIIEAIEAKEQTRFALGVQWHPECYWQDADALSIFKSFVESCGE